MSLTLFVFPLFKMDPCYHQKGGQLGVCILPEQTAWIERTVFAGELCQPQAGVSQFLSVKMRRKNKIIQFWFMLVYAVVQIYP